MPSPPQADRRAKWTALGLLVFAEVAAMALWFSASAVVPQLAQEWDLDGGQRAWLTISVQLGFVAGALVSAGLNIADRVSSQALLGICGLAGAAFNALMVLDDVTLGTALTLRFGTGAMLAGVYPPGMKLAASWSSRDRGLAIGLLVGAIALGSALPHLLNAVPLFGGQGMPPWRPVLLAASVCASLGAVVAWTFLRPGPHGARTAPFDWRYTTRILADRPVRLANLGYLGHMWELYAMWTWVPIFLIASYDHAGWPVRDARLAGFAAVAIGAAGSVIAGVFADRWGRTTVAAGSLVVSGACCLVAGWTFEHPGLATIVCLVWGFAVVADSAQFSAAVSELSDPRYVGTALTLQTSLGFLLTAGTIQLVPTLRETLSWSAVFPVLAVGPVIGVVSMLRLRRLPEARKLASGNG